MRRRSFLLRSAMAGITVGCLPGAVFAGTRNTPKIQNINLPEALGQVRHGLLQKSLEVPQGIPAWIQQLQRNRFFKNGLHAGADDLVHFTFQLENLPVITLGFEGNKIWKGTAGSIEEITINEDVTELNLYTEGFVIQRLSARKKQNIKLPKHAEKTLLLAIHDKVAVESVFLEENSALLIDRAEELVLVGDQNATVLLISKI